MNALIALTQRLGRISDCDRDRDRDRDLDLDLWLFATLQKAEGKDTDSY